MLTPRWYIYGYFTVKGYRISGAELVLEEKVSSNYIKYITTKINPLFLTYLNNKLEYVNIGNILQ